MTSFAHPFQQYSQYSPQMSQQQTPPNHYRTTLNNVGQAWGRLIEYADSQTGPLNAAQWTSIAYVDRIEYGRGSGSTKGSARERAARKALVALGVIQA
ncbi:hypothetical protein DFH06DRAFT_1187036 [Mycena polygramma]|nr:hypothetical protein DFH06DRAFT_1207078 [Mycena polygramma]KAJ7665325.1 hypothetical protein DFH06DRAFT_1187036 [Mycena polygramma]